MIFDPVTLEKIGKAPVNFLLGWLQEKNTGYCLDGDDQPCVEIKDDPEQTLHRLVDDRGKPSLRARSFLRSLFRYRTEQKLHISDADLALVVDYLVEEAFKGGRKVVKTQAAQEGDYNFEGVVVFANSLRQTEDQEKMLGNKLLDGIFAGENDQRLKPKFTWNVEQQTLVAELRTADLWRAVNSHEVEVQVRADKESLLKAINFFSRRLGELEEQFRRVGLEVEVSHKDTGSWVTITRRDRVFRPDQAILVTPTDGARPSASAPSSGHKAIASNALEVTDDNRLEIETKTSHKVARP